MHQLHNRKGGAKELVPLFSLSSVIRKVEGQDIGKKGQEKNKIKKVKKKGFTKELK